MSKNKPYSTDSVHAGEKGSYESTQTFCEIADFFKFVLRKESGILKKFSIFWTGFKKNNEFQEGGNQLTKKRRITKN